MKKKKNSGSKIRAIVIMLVIGAIFGYLGVNVGKQIASASLSNLALVVICVAILPVFFFVIGFHEAGHAWVGRLVGFDFRMYVVGPFLWEKSSVGWKFKWNRNLNVAGGMVVCIPTDDYNLLKRFSWYAAGGPLASIVLVLIAAVGYKALSAFINIGTTGEVITYLLLLVGILSAFIFIATIIPVRVGGFSSDGLRILTMLRGGDHAKLEAIMLKTVGASMAGLKPANYNIIELKDALGLAQKLDAPLGLYINYFCYQAYMDLNQNDTAEEHLNFYMLQVDNLPESLQGSVWLEAAYFYAVMRRDLQKAETYFSKYAPSPLIPLAQVYATQSAIAQLKQQPEEALRFANMARKEISNMMDQGVARAIESRLAN
jgi:hypothetical protein